MHGINRLGAGLLLAASLAAAGPVAAQGLGDIGRQLQEGVMGGGRSAPGNRDRDSYERGRQDALRDQQRPRDLDRQRDDIQRRRDDDRRATRDEDRRPSRDQGDRRRMEEPRRYDDGGGITTPFTGRPRN